ncbi:MAG: hypothetical protein ABIS45_08450 [Burkholderiales bacterium]
MTRQLYILALTLTGCAVAASAYVARHNARRRVAEERHKALCVWEDDGGHAVPLPRHQVQAL